MFVIDVLLATGIVVSRRNINTSNGQIVYKLTVQLYQTNHVLSSYKQQVLTPKEIHQSDTPKIIARMIIILIVVSGKSRLHWGTTSYIIS